MMPIIPEKIVDHDNDEKQIDEEDLIDVDTNEGM